MPCGRSRVGLWPMGLLVLLPFSALLALAGPTGGTVTTAKPVSKPPFYRGKLAGEARASGHTPLAVARPMAGLPEEDWVPAAALERLARDANAWLERNATSRPLPGLAPSGKAVPPVIYFGCALDPLVPGECADDAKQNVLETTGGTRDWRAQAASAAREHGVDRILVLQLDLAPHWVHQRNLKGTKEVLLGTGYAMRLPWLTSLDTPVYVLQLSGAVVDAEGKILRSGAEGLWAVRTPFRASMLRSQKLMSDEDMEHVRTELRRDDLPGRPLVWEAALQQLLFQLSGAADTVARR